MPNSTTPSGPRFLTHPRALIVDTVAGAEPDLPSGVIESTVDRVADTRAKLRRLAQALDSSPDLLTSGKPEGPRLVELLIRALQPHGATRLVLPRCADCGKQRSLDRVDGTRRLCSPCAVKASDAVPRLPCAVCGKALLVSSRDSKGQPRCRQHRPQDADGVDLVCGLLRKMNTGLDDKTLTEIVEQAAPKPFQRRQIAAELTHRPDLLTGRGAYGSPRVLALINALVAHGARTIQQPTCPFCHRTAPLKFRRDEARCCRRCYDTARLQPCSSCGHQKPVTTRTPDGQPLCTSCMRSDPINHETCTGCGRTAIAVHHDEDGNALCGRCWRPPAATCSVCGKHRPCNYADSDSPRCLSCLRVQNQATCSRCGTFRIVWGRSGDKEPLCAPCGRPSEHCSTCGRLLRVTGRTTDGQPLCRTCYPKHPVSFRACTECGIIEHLHHLGLCTKCAAPRQLRAALTRPDGSIRAELEPVITALTGSDPHRLLVWIREKAPRQLLATFAVGTGPVTHAALDDLPPSRALVHFRSILVATNVLPERDEYLARIEQWLDHVLEEVAMPEDRRVLRSFVTWFHLRRLRRRSARRPLTQYQISPVRYEVSASIRLLEWLRDHGTDLDTCSQDDIDQWLSSDQTGRRAVRNFITWAVEHRHAKAIDIPTRSDLHSRGQVLLPETDQRWTLSKRLLHDTTLDTVDRVAGCLVLLYAQPCSRITRLTTSHVTETSKGVRLHLGTRPVDIPEPLGGLIRELVRTRQGRAVVGHTGTTPWLIPGGLPGRPMAPTHLMHRLNGIGLPTRAGRGTALMELAGQLPATVLSRLLGLHINTATAWSQEAGNTRPGYAAEVARRALRKNQ